MRIFKKLVVFILAMVVSVVFVSCTPKNMTEGYEKMENYGYKVEKLSADDIIDMFSGFDVGVTAGISCEKDEESLAAFWCEETDDAKDFAVLIKLVVKNLEKAQDEDNPIEYEYGRKGKVVYFGTEKGCDDFNK